MASAKLALEDPRSQLASQSWKKAVWPTRSFQQQHHCFKKSKVACAMSPHLLMASSTHHLLEPYTKDAGECSSVGTSQKSRGSVPEPMPMPKPKPKAMLEATVS